MQQRKCEPELRIIKENARSADLSYMIYLCNENSQLVYTPAGDKNYEKKSQKREKKIKKIEAIVLSSSMYISENKMNINYKSKKERKKTR